MTNKKYKVAILGCGKMGAFYDFKALTPQPPLSHLTAFNSHKNFEVLAIIDSNETTLKLINKKYKIPYSFTSLDSFKDSKISVDVISICTPTKEHYENIYKVLNIKPKLIFCEKPITNCINFSNQVVELCKKTDVKLLVNFSRRWDPFINKLKENIKNNTFGDISRIFAKTNNGILNYGSHLFDLLFYLFDEINEDKIKFYSINRNDVSLSLNIGQSSETPVEIYMSNDKNYSLFEIEFFFSKYIISMFNGGLYWGFRKITQDKIFPNIYSPKKFVFKKGNVLDTLSRATDHIYEILENKINITSDGISALRAEKICDLILKKQMNL